METHLMYQAQTALVKAKMMINQILKTGKSGCKMTLN